MPTYPQQSRFLLLLEVVAHLFCWNPLAGVDLGGGPIDVGESFGRKEVIEVLGFLVRVVLQHVGDVFVNGYEARGRRATLGLLIELIIQLNSVHGSHLPRLPPSIRSSPVSVTDSAQSQRGRLGGGRDHPPQACPCRLGGFVPCAQANAFCAEGDPFRPLAAVAPVGREESHGSMSKENLKDRRELLIP